MEIDLSKSVEEKLQSMISTGKLDEIISGQIEGMIQNVVRDVFSSYGDVSKQFKEIVKERIKIDFDRINFGEYNHNMSTIIKKMVESELTRLGTEKFKEALDTMLTDNIPKNMKLSELMNKFKEHITEQKDGEGNISFHCKGSSVTSLDYKHISFDEDEGKSEYGCTFRLMLNEKREICSVSIDGKEFKEKLILGGLYGFEAFLFKAYSFGMIIEIDTEDIDTYYGRNEN